MSGLPSQPLLNREALLTNDEAKTLTKLYNKGPAAFGNAKRLSEQSGLPKSKTLHFLHGKATHTKYTNVRRNFQRLKVVAFEINEIWSIDLAYVDKLSKYNDGIKYLLVAVDVLSRYLRVQPIKTKSAKAASEAFAKMLGKRVKPKKVWSDKGTEFKAEFLKLCKQKNIKWYSTQSETKSAFAERNIRSLKNIIYKYLEEKWTYRYIDSLPEFVKTINTRVNRVTGLAPSKVTKNDVVHLISLADGNRLVKKPKLKIGDTVRIAKQDLPFKKGYKQNFTDELFTIVDVPTVHPPTYTLIDEDKEIILGKFYQPELIKVIQ